MPLVLRYLPTEKKIKFSLSNTLHEDYLSVHSQVACLSCFRFAQKILTLMLLSVHSASYKIHTSPARHIRSSPSTTHSRVASKDNKHMTRSKTQQSLSRHTVYSAAPILPWSGPTVLACNPVERWLHSIDHLLHARTGSQDLDRQITCGTSGARLL